MDPDVAAGVDSQRAVVKVIPDFTVGTGCCRCVFIVRVALCCSGAADNRSAGIGCADQFLELSYRRSKRYELFPRGVVDRCFRCDDKIDIMGSSRHQLQHDSVLLGLIEREFYVVRIEIGLDDFDRNLLVWFFAAVIDSQRYDDRQEHGYSGCDPALEMAALFPCLENQQVTDQYPERAAQNAGVFVPLHQLYVVCESVAERQPREGDFTADIEVFV